MPIIPTTGYHEYLINPKRWPAHAGVPRKEIHHSHRGKASHFPRDLCPRIIVPWVAVPWEMLMAGTPEPSTDSSLTSSHTEGHRSKGRIFYKCSIYNALQAWTEKWTMQKKKMPCLQSQKYLGISLRYRQKQSSQTEVMFRHRSIFQKTPLGLEIKVAQ